MKYQTINELAAAPKATLAKQEIDPAPLRNDINQCIDRLRNIKGSEPAASVIKFVENALRNADKIDTAPAQYRYELRRLSLFLSLVTLGDL